MVTLGASAVFGLAAVFLARSWINNSVEAEFQTAQTLSENAKVQLVKTISKPIVVANLDLAFGDTLSADNLTVVEYPEQAVPDGAYENVEDLLADAPRRVLLGHIAQFEPILSHKISGEGGRRALSQLIAEGMRAVTIGVSLTSGVGGHVLPGDRVDILYIRNLDREGRNPLNTKTDVLFQNVKILGVDQNVNTRSEDIAVRRSVTFEVTNDQAQKMFLAQDSGEIVLTLRRAGEVELHPQYNLDLKDLLAGIQSDKAKPKARTKQQPPKKAKGPVLAQVTVIRGDDRAQVSVLRDTDNSELAGG
jgi:pilus assembly protein CpaB